MELVIVWIYILPIAECSPLQIVLELTQTRHYPTQIMHYKHLHESDLYVICLYFFVVVYRHYLSGRVGQWGRPSYMSSAIHFTKAPKASSSMNWPEERP